MLNVPASPSASSVSTPTLAAPPLTPRSHSRTVLIVSSDQSLRERLRGALTGLRWTVLEAVGGAAAWEASQGLLLEALVLDSWLPDLDASEFLKEFQREYPTVDLMRTDGISATDGVRSPYRQEVLYALRRSQEVDTAAWNTAPVLLGKGSRLHGTEPWMPNSSRATPLRNDQTSRSETIRDVLYSNQSEGLHSDLAEERFRDTAELKRAELVDKAPVPIRRDGVDPSREAGLGEVEAETRFVRSNLSGSAIGGCELSGINRQGMQPNLEESRYEPDGCVVSRYASSRPTGTLRESASVERIPELIGTCSQMLEISRRVRLVAERTTPVLIEGPTGSGKEVVAAALHRLSKRNRKPIVAINCAAIPEALLESELFGHTRGAFTGAVQGRVGRIESADGGTLFLDEIGEMPLALQSKLLRFVESGELQRIGDNETIRVDVRIVAATHQPLAENAQKGSFRADLYYRLAVFLIHTPALIAHMPDLPQLVEFFLERLGRHSPAKRIDSSAMSRLSNHGWPGNVRELEHVLERASILAGDNPVITAEEIDFGLTAAN